MSGIAIQCRRAKIFERFNLKRNFINAILLTVPILTAATYSLPLASLSLHDWSKQEGADFRLRHHVVNEMEIQKIQDVRFELEKIIEV